MSLKIKKFGVPAAIVIVSALLFSFLPFNLNNALIRPLLGDRVPVSNADILVVLGGGLKLDGTLSDLSAERVDEAVRINKESGTALLFSGGETPTGIEAEAMSKRATELGYTGLKHIEASSHSTYENAFYTDQLLDENRFADDTVLIVTSPYHSRRALAVFRRVMPERRVFITYTDDSVVLNNTLFGRWRGLYAILREYAANAWYAVRYRTIGSAEPSQFVKGERLDFQMRDGIRIQADYYEGVTDKAVILLHGYQQDRGVYEPFIPALQQKGWHVLNVDLRGHGQSVGDLAAFTSKEFQEIPVDLVSLSQWLKGKQPDMQVVLLGADLSANASLFAASLSDAFSGVVAITPQASDHGISIASTVGRLRIPVLYLAAKDDAVRHDATGVLYARTGTAVNQRQFVEYETGGQGTGLLFSSPNVASEIVRFVDGL